MTRRQFVGAVIALMAAWLVGRKGDLRRMLARVLDEPYDVALFRVGDVAEYQWTNGLTGVPVTSGARGRITEVGKDFITVSWL